MSEPVSRTITPPLFDDADEAVEAIQHGYVDAFVVNKGGEEPKVVVLEGADEPYRVLVERMSEGALTISDEGSILYVNDRVSELTGYPAEQLLNRNIASLFEGDVPTLVPNMSDEASLLRSDKRSLPVRVWSRPLSFGQSSATLVTLADLSIHRRAEEIAAAERFARSVLEQATNAILVLAPDGRITHASAVAQDLAQGSPVGRMFSKAFPLQGRSGEDSFGDLDRQLATKPFHGVEVTLRSDSLRNRVFLLSAGPLLDEKKEQRGSIVNLTEITDRKRAEEQQAVIAAELDHRVKNILTIVQSLAMQTARSSRSLDDFYRAFSGRIDALRVAHDILTQTRWAGIGLNELIATVLAPFSATGEQRVHTTGPAIRLPGDKVVPFSMAFHELATNAVKYGALSAVGGHLNVRWETSGADDRLVELLWEERGGPRVEQRGSSGFGTKLINRVLASELNGTTKIDFEPDGFRCTIKFRV